MWFYDTRAPGPWQAFPHLQGKEHESQHAVTSLLFFPIASGHGHRSPFEAALSWPEVEPEAQGGGHWDWHWEPAFTSLHSTTQEFNEQVQYAGSAPKQAF